MQPLDKVENEIMNKLYMEKMEPALRDYLAQLREESYVMVKPGYTDTRRRGGRQRDSGSGADAGHADKKKDKKKMPLPKVNGQ